MWIVLASLAAPSGWSITVGGDLMLNGIPPHRRPLERVASLLGAADVSVANLEIPLTRASRPTARKSVEELRAKTQFVLQADPAHATHLSEAGLDAVTLATNHTMDYGEQGLRECLRTLRGAGLKFAGAGADLSEAAQPAVLPLPGGRRIAIVAALSFVGHRANWKATPAAPTKAGVLAWAFGGAVSPAVRRSLREAVERCRQRAEFVAFAIHTGLERQTLPTPYQIELGRACVQAGADLVLQHHPHVLQGAELFQGKPILYSVGNLVSALPGRTALFHLRFSADGKLLRFRITPCRIAGGRVAPLRGAEAARERARFDQLSLRLSRRYPHPEAQPLPSSFESTEAGSAILGHGL